MARQHNTTPTPQRAALYVRLSKKRLDANDNLDRMERELRALVRKDGNEVVEVFRDNDTAFESDQRPDFARLVSFIRDGRCDVVYARHADRLVRNDYERALFNRDLARHGVKVKTMAGEYDVNDPTGKLTGTILGAIGEYESSVKQQRIKLKHVELAEKGLRAGGGTRAYGHSKDRSEIVEHEAAVIREVAARILAGASFATEAQRLNDQGVPTISGKPWTGGRLSTMLAGARLSARREHHGRITASTNWAPIISPEQSDRLRALREMNVELASHRRTPRRYVLTGLLRCGKPQRDGTICDGKMISRPRHDGGRTYMCGVCHGTNVVADPIEAEVIGQAMARLDQSKLAKMAKRANDPSKAAVRLRGVESRQTKLATDFALGKIPDAAYEAARDALNVERQAALAELEDLSAPDPLAGVSGPLREAWDSFDIARQRAVLSVVIDHVTVLKSERATAKFDPNRVQITWRV